MQKWEYLRVLVSGEIRDNPDMELDKLGEEGWELVAVRPASVTMVEVWFFKRPKVEQLGTIA